MRRIYSEGLRECRRHILRVLEKGWFRYTLKKFWQTAKVQESMHILQRSKCTKNGNNLTWHTCSVHYAKFNQVFVFKNLYECHVIYECSAHSLDGCFLFVCKFLKYDWHFLLSVKLSLVSIFPPFTLNHVTSCFLFVSLFASLPIVPFFWFNWWDKELKDKEEN